MILKDILARELKVWPEGARICFQNGDGEVSFSDGHTADFFGGDSAWHNRYGVYGFESFDSEVAEDFAISIVTRAEWQAAVEALKAEQESEPVIDWSKQPKEFPLWLEGITEEHRKYSGWYRRNGEVYKSEDTGQWRVSREGQFFTVHTRPINPPVADEQAAELKWPDRATHYAGAYKEWESSWYIIKDDKIACMLDDGNDEDWGWREIDSEDREELLPRLIPRPTERAVEWDGVGLPPVGIECSVLNSALGNPAWERCTILYSGKHRVMYDSESCEERVAYIQDLKFRKTKAIRTQEQIDAEEREKAIIAIRDDLDVPTAIAARAYDKGYRKQPK